MPITTVHIPRSRMRLARLVALATLYVALSPSGWSLTEQAANPPGQVAAQAPTLKLDYKDSSTKEAFRYWSPGYSQSIRGIVVLVPGANQDGRSMLDDAAWQNFAQEHRLALVSCFILGSDPTDGSGDALERAIATFAAQSAHPELPHAPLLMYGESAGGQFNYNFAFWKPTRVLAFIANKGGIYNDESPDPRAYAIPGLFFIGMNDTKSRIDTITKIWADGRRQGALWALAPQPNSAHEFSKTPAIARTFFRAVLDSRLPNPTTAVDGARMKPMNESQGWIGDLTTHEIRPAASDVPAMDSAWLPNQAIATAWRAFVSVPQLAISTALSFEVATVKPVIVDQSHPLNPRHFWVHVNPPHASYWSMTVASLFGYAYGAESYQIAGPTSTTEDRFDIEARIPDGTLRPDDRRMLQSLLTERFNLAFHMEKRESTVYVLSLGKHGEKLNPSLPDSARPGTGTPASVSNSEDGPAKSTVTNNPDGSSTIDMGKRGTQTIKFDQEDWSQHWEFSKMTMEDLAGRLSICLGSGVQHIEDQTGVKGNYQVAFDCPISSPWPPANSSSGSTLPLEPQDSSSLFRSLDALGLKLEKRKIQVDVYVIDHIERPSAN
jgi:uncharacterized protein (TIGR03435 family)